MADSGACPAVPLAARRRRSHERSQLPPAPPTAAAPQARSSRAAPAPPPPPSAERGHGAQQRPPVPMSSSRASSLGSQRQRRSTEEADHVRPSHRATFLPHLDCSDTAEAGQRVPPRSRGNSSTIPARRARSLSTQGETCGSSQRQASEEIVVRESDFKKYAGDLTMLRKVQIAPLVPQEHAPEPHVPLSSRELHEQRCRAYSEVMDPWEGLENPEISREPNEQDLTVNEVWHKKGTPRSKKIESEAEFYAGKPLSEWPTEAEREASLNRAAPCNLEAARAAAKSAELSEWLRGDEWKVGGQRGESSRRNSSRQSRVEKGRSSSIGSAGEKGRSSSISSAASTQATGSRSGPSPASTSSGPSSGRSRDPSPRPGYALEFASCARGGNEQKDDSMAENDPKIVQKRWRADSRERQRQGASDRPPLAPGRNLCLPKLSARGATGAESTTPPPESPRTAKDARARSVSSTTRPIEEVRLVEKMRASAGSRNGKRQQTQRPRPRPPPLTIE